MLRHIGSPWEQERDIENSQAKEYRLITPWEQERNRDFTKAGVIRCTSR